MNTKGSIFCQVMASIPMNFLVGAPASLADAATTFDAVGLNAGLLEGLHRGLLAFCSSGARACT